MRRLFFAALAFAVLIEIVRAYLMLGAPGTGNVESLQAAYFLHTQRWILRSIFFLVAVAGAIGGFQVRRILLPAVAALTALTIAWIADLRTDVSRFEPAENVSLVPFDRAALDDRDRVIGVVRNGVARAYPVKYLQFHHQVKDSFGETPAIVTYCLVCGSARVYEPLVRGRREKFRLIALNRENAVFEDVATGSWWMQATGRAEAGPLEGEELRAWDVQELTARKFLDLYPDALFMQAVAKYAPEYAHVQENVSKMERSWVVRLELGSDSKAVQWFTLQSQRKVTENIGDKLATLFLANDGISIAAFERPALDDRFSLAANDVIMMNGIAYDFSGRSLDGRSPGLVRVPAFMETSGCWEEFEDDASQAKRQDGQG